MADFIELWLKLVFSGLPLKDLKKLYEKYENPEKIQQFIKEETLFKKFAKSLNSDETNSKVKKIIEESIKKKIKLITLNDSNYPEKLKTIYDPPPVLFVKGEIFNPKDNPVLSIVGTRRATAYGKSVLEKIIPPLVEAGFIIASGLASGIDSWAHQLTLNNKGITWAFLGHSVDYIYPANNRNLYQQIISKNGALVSEFPPGTLPRKWYFPLRNRLISGVATGVLVIEANYQSGAMITAKLALDEGREVMAIPGSIFNENSKGCHWLIKQGAGLVENAEDILKILNLPSLFPKKIKESLKISNIGKKILKALQEKDLTLEEIAKKTGESLAPLSAEIINLVMNDIILELPGGRFQKIDSDFP